MSFFKTLSEKLGFIADESDDDRNDDELEDGEIQDEEDEEEEEDARPSRFSLNNPFGKGKKQTASGRRKPAAVEYDEDEEEDEPQVGRQSRHSNVIHDSRMDPRAAQEAQYTHCERIVNVRQIEECREIIKYLLRGESVLLNLENIDPKDCGRVVDLLSGAARGIGFSIGFTVLGALLLYVLQSIALANLPIIGKFLAELVRIVESNL